jgi:hypothetical protein
MSAASPASREVLQICALVAGVILFGAMLQLWIAPGPLALVAAASIAGVAVFALSLIVPGRLRQTLVGFRFVSVLLVALAVAAILGTLVLQGKPEQLYLMKYGSLVGGAIVALRLDDIFHSLWFAGLLALFGAAVVASAIVRWPPKLRNAGFFACHVGLVTTLVGAALSTTLSVRGRVDLHAGGEHVTEVRVERAGMVTAPTIPLGFDLRLDRFDVVRYHAEYRVAYYEEKDGSFRLKASFDPDPERHRLPGGDSFRVKALYPDFTVGSASSVHGGPVPQSGTASNDMRNPAVLLEVSQAGRKHEVLLVASRGGGIRLDRGGAIAFEHREDEVKAYQSNVTATAGGLQEKATIAVNDPLSFKGWTLYQVNYNPKDPTYSGLEAVRDPGVIWVFVGFAFISFGVFYMFYVESRLKRRREV